MTSALRRLSTTLKPPKMPTPGLPSVSIHTLQKPVKPSGTTLTGGKPQEPPDSRGFKFMVFPPPPGKQQATISELGPNGQKGPPNIVGFGEPPHAFVETDARVTTTGTSTAPGGVTVVDGEVLGTTIKGPRYEKDILTLNSGESLYETGVGSYAGPMVTRADFKGQEWIARMNQGTADGFVFDLGRLPEAANREAAKFADDWAIRNPQYSFKEGKHCFLFARDLAVHLLKTGHLTSTNPAGAQALANADVGHIFSTRLASLLEGAGLADATGKPAQVRIAGNPKPEPGIPKFISDVGTGAVTVSAHLAQAAPGDLVSFQFWHVGQHEFGKFGKAAGLLDAQLGSQGAKARIESATLELLDSNNKVTSRTTYSDPNAGAGRPADHRDYLELDFDASMTSSRAFVTVNVRKGPEEAA